MSPAIDQKRLSIDSRSSEDSASSHVYNQNHGLFTPPESRKSTPASSVVGTSQHDDSKSSSRTPSSEFAPPVLNQSTSTSSVIEPISYAVAEIDGSRFSYLKIASHLVPTGWSNDPGHLQIVSNGFDVDVYALQGPMLAVLASDSGHKTPRYLVSHYGKLYFWTPGCDELLYVTELYTLNKILRRTDEGFVMQTKPLRPLSHHSPPDQPLYHSLWFWEVPKGWSQSFLDLEYIQDVIPGCCQYGLPLFVPMLLTNKISGSTIFFLKSGEEYYVYYEISSELVHVDHPTNLHEILRVLGTEQFLDLKTTHVNMLPEYGGPNVVADENVPEGWTNKISQEVCCGQSFFERGIYASNIPLLREGSLNGTPRYMVEAEREEYYIWTPDPDKVLHIDKAEGLQDILDILKDPSRQLSLTEVEVKSRYKGHGRTTKDDSATKPKS